MSVINLNKHRKSKARAQDKARADENSAKFGKSAAQKKEQQRKAARDARRLDAHKR